MITGIWLLMFIIIGTIGSLFLFTSHETQFSDYRLKLQYEKQFQTLSSEITNKDERLAKLESMLYELTTQTNDFKSKLENLKELKNVMDKMEKSDSKLTSLLFENSLSTSSPPNQGGIYQTAPMQDIRIVAEKASEEMETLASTMSDLIGELEKKEDDLITEAFALAQKPTIWPTTSNQITSVFGYRKDPINNKPSFHTGIDIEGESTDVIYATADGVITETGFTSDQGNHILIDHGNSFKTAYLHLSKISVSVGQKVVKGQKIGLMGSTGRSTGTHLHYEVLLDGVSVNPKPYLLEKITK